MPILLGKALEAAENWPRFFNVEAGGRYITALVEVPLGADQPEEVSQRGELRVHVSMDSQKP